MSQSGKEKLPQKSEGDSTHKTSPQRSVKARRASQDLLSNDLTFKNPRYADDHSTGFL